MRTLRLRLPGLPGISYLRLLLLLLPGLLDAIRLALLLLLLRLLWRLLPSRLLLLWLRLLWWLRLLLLWLLRLPALSAPLFLLLLRVLLRLWLLLLRLLLRLPALSAPLLLLLLRVLLRLLLLSRLSLRALLFCWRLRVLPALPFRPTLFIVLPVGLRERRHKRREKYKHSSGGDSSNGRHGNRLLRPLVLKHADRQWAGAHIICYSIFSLASEPVMRISRLPLVSRTISRPSSWVAPRPVYVSSSVRRFKPVSRSRGADCHQARL